MLIFIYAYAYDYALCLCLCLCFMLEQHFSVWLFSNQGDKTFFFLKFNEARISELNIGTNLH